MSRHSGLILAFLGAALVARAETRAATLTVTSTGDSGTGSLRETIATAGPGDQIRFDEALSGIPILLTTGEILIDKSLAIDGSGRDRTIVDGNASSRIFTIAEGATATLTGLTIRNGFEGHLTANGRAIGEGGGILNAGELRLVDCELRSNTVTAQLCPDGPNGHCSPLSVRGGGIFNRGRLVLDHCLLTGNLADAFPRAYGGGLYNSGNADLRDTSVSGNVGQADRFLGVEGLGLYNDASGTLTLLRTAVDDNPNGASHALVNLGQLEMSESTVARNRGPAAGGISNSGTATLLGCRIGGNDSGAFGSGGAGIYNTGRMLLERSAVDANTGYGTAGIFNDGLLRVVNTTISGNASVTRAGGLWNFGGTATFIQATIVDNSTGDAGPGAGVVVRDGSTVELKGSLVAGNLATSTDPSPSDCHGQVVSLGHNLLGDGADCVGLSDGLGGDIVGLDWTLVLERTPLGRPALADNGGPTPTVALLPGAPVVDLVPAADCADEQGLAVETDQRVVVDRPQGPGCEPGAFELASPRTRFFWTQQCREKGTVEYGPAELGGFFASIIEASGAFPECAPAICATLEPQGRRGSDRARAARELLAVRLNLASGRLTNGRPIDLAPLTAAETVGAAVAEIEAAFCDAAATRDELRRASDLAEALNGGGLD